MKVFKPAGGAFFQRQRNLVVEIDAGRFQNAGRALVHERHFAVLGEHAYAVTDLAEYFRQVWMRRHRVLDYNFAIRISQFECVIFFNSMRPSKKLKLRWRELQMIVRGLVSTKHVLLAHIIPTRKCNLACGYCNEYDDFSPPIPAGVMLRRIDRLAYLKTAIVTISGGEPLLHPEIETIIQRIRRHGMIAGMITNGYLLTPKKILALNEAGLDHLQISIDNIQPDDVSMKSLKVLDKKLEYLAQFAEFAVNINSVIGSGIRNPEDAVTITRRALQLGFASSLGIIHDGGGSMKPLNRREERVYREIKSYSKQSYSRLYWFQENLARGKPNDWRCRAGARYLYICEDGLVHYCSQQRGYPGVPLEKYTFADIQREYFTKKACAPHCTVGCVQKISVIDHWRDPQADWTNYINAG